MSTRKINGKSRATNYCSMEDSREILKEKVQAALMNESRGMLKTSLFKKFNIFMRS